MRSGAARALAVTDDSLDAIRRKFVSTWADLRRALWPRVLIADDNDAFAQLLSKALERREIGAAISHAQGGVRVLLAHGTAYGLLILDGAWGPDDGEKTPILYVSGNDLADLPLRPQAGFRSKLDGVEAIADEIQGRVR